MNEELGVFNSILHLVYNKHIYMTKIIFNNKTEEDMINYLANSIREIMGEFEDPFDLDYLANPYGDDQKRYLKLKECCLLINELLSYKPINEAILSMANNDTSDVDNKMDNDIKYEMFSILRNIFIHFPNFHTWNEIYINKELLSWNNRYNSRIYRFFNENIGKTLKYTIYNKNKDTNKWEIEKKVIIKVPNEIPKEEKLFLNSFISFDDVVTTLHIVDYYLDYLGLELIKYKPVYRSI